MTVLNISNQKFGENAILYSLTNDNGLTMKVTNLGARIVELIVPVKGEQRNIILGFDSAEEYVAKDMYFGATIGRVAGRIKHGSFSIDEHNYQLPISPENGHTLHGGSKSFESRIWEAEIAETNEQVSVLFSYLSPDGENGFPGELQARVTYTLTNNNEWILDYYAKTDQPTLYNPTNHVYFNLTGDVTQPVDQHLLFVDADRFAVVADDTTVTGELRSVTGTPFDFRKPQSMKQVFQTAYEQNRLVGGLDHPFILNQTGFDQAQAMIIAPQKDLTVEMYTDRPAVVIFTAQFGDNGPEVRGQKLVSHGGITLETQVSPGAVEFEGFGDIQLRPENPYQSRTLFKIK
ncbi:galactose mutarotase [Enterococcus sp. 7E2_DIV0204]|uniref:aldose epimerase family protein n=1 Tax=unclassified Enterococcus TaxID=2608891 RepID=UPI000B662AE1|nr:MULTISPECIES: aldose epimerase family protein [unclassified Enterococcus]OTN86393.1 galactose mutarotase [Enterococcus sp. 7E2_DIV0204]OTP48414.1 galactose mutarotase [Enterococcus sp. 7D2_DIV0200]